MKHYLRKDNGKDLLDFEEYETNEIVVSKNPPKIKKRKNFMYIEPSIEYHKNKGKFILLYQENGEIIKEYNMSDLEGIKFLGNTSGFSTMGIFLGQFNLKTSLEQELINSRKEGWYTRNKYLKHYIIFEDTHIEFLSKKKYKCRASKIKENKKILYTIERKIEIRKKRYYL